MKNIIVLAICLSAWISPAYACMDYEPQIKPFETVEVSNVAGHTQKEIYIAVKNWAAETFNDAKVTTTNDDPNTGTIYIRSRRLVQEAPTGLFGDVIGAPMYMFFSIRVDTKDDKYRVTFNLMRSEDQPYAGVVCKGWNDNTREGISDIKASLHNAVIKNKSW